LPDKFTKFSKGCPYRTHHGFCDRDYEDGTPCKVSNCKYPEWLKIKEEKKMMRIKDSTIWFLILIGCIAMLCGCTHLAELEEGQAVVSETQVEGIDLSIPIPFVENVNILQLRFGFIQHKIYKGHNVPYYSDSKYEDISLIKGMGSITRILSIGHEEPPKDK
jgi:hypothetical protein